MLADVHMLLFHLLTVQRQLDKDARAQAQGIQGTSDSRLLDSHPCEHIRVLISSDSASIFMSDTPKKEDEGSEILERQ